MSPPPLDGLTIVDFSQFLAGPYCSLRLLDLGARVIKIENPDGGDLSRQLYLSDTKLGEDSTLFHAINRGKESVALDLKHADGLAQAIELVKSADVMIQNFRPGVIERLGLGYDVIQTVNPTIIYGSISGYGPGDTWVDLPGQDLLAQARSGVMWLSGNRDSGPVPIGLPIADMMAGAALSQGILASLFRRERVGVGAHVETSLLEAMIDLQFEFLTTYLNNGRTAPERLKHGSAHGYLGAPYGVFETSNGHLALAMGDLHRLCDVLELQDLAPLLDHPDPSFHHRDQIQAILAERFLSQDSAYLERHLTQHNIWCAKVLSWDDLLNTQSFKALNIVDPATDSDCTLIRAPLRIDQIRAPITGLGPRLAAK